MGPVIGAALYYLSPPELLLGFVLYPPIQKIKYSRLEKKINSGAPNQCNLEIFKLLRFKQKIRDQTVLYLFICKAFFRGPELVLGRAPNTGRR
ncbi:hypothetical protein V5738_16445 [Salinisphaera sp. SPP-AMP-43]|uniref:hypothetical protein n=1 Tax=Salinisphaera sp. SPP-AMP-43 TaxID=3121288 RepID=UPI003C6DC08E